MDGVHLTVSTVAPHPGLRYLGTMASTRRNLPIFAKVPKPEPAGQQTFFKMPNPFELEQWKVYGKYLSAHGRVLAKNEEVLAEKCGWFMWDIGDWLLEGEEAGMPTKKLRKYAEEICRHRAWKTMRNWKVTSRAIESSRRRDGREGRESLPYSVHQIIEQFDPEIQEQFLHDGPKTKDGMRKYVRDWREQEKLKRERDKFDRELAAGRPYRIGQDDATKPKSLNIKVYAAEYDTLNKLSWMKFGNHWPKTMFLWMAREYWREHKADMDAEYAAFQKQTPEERNAHWEKVSEEHHSRRSRPENSSQPNP